MGVSDYIWLAVILFFLIIVWLYRRTSSIKGLEAEITALRGAPSQTYCQRRQAPLVCAHGGDSTDAPPNSALAFETALSAGIACVEVDVARTRDGELVVLHPRELAALTGIPGLQASDYTWDELAELRWPGTQENVLRFEPLLRQLQPVTHTIIVDLKPRLGGSGIGADAEELVAQVAAALGTTPCPNCIVWGKDDELALSVKSAVPSVAAGYVLMNETVQARESGRDQALRAADASVAGVHYAMTSPQLTRQLHAAGQRVVAWTANTPEMMRQVLDAGVDAVVTNHPAQLTRAIAERGDACLRLYGAQPAR